jgi:hypothetical protein
MEQATANAPPTYQQRKFRCPAPDCQRIMILTPSEYAEGGHVCPYCGDKNDPKLNARRARREKILRPLIGWLQSHIPDSAKRKLKGTKPFFLDILDEATTPRCQIVRTSGHAICSDSTGRRSITHSFGYRTRHTGQPAIVKPCELSTMQGTWRWLSGEKIDLLMTAYEGKSLWTRNQRCLSPVSIRAINLSGSAE